MSCSGRQLSSDIRGVDCDWKGVAGFLTPASCGMRVMDWTDGWFVESTGNAKFDGCRAEPAILFHPMKFIN